MLISTPMVSLRLKSEMTTGAGMVMLVSESASDPSSLTSSSSSAIALDRVIREPDMSCVQLEGCGLLSEFCPIGIDVQRANTPPNKMEAKPESDPAAETVLATQAHSISHASEQSGEGSATLTNSSVGAWLKANGLDPELYQKPIPRTIRCVPRHLTSLLLLDLSLNLCFLTPCNDAALCHVILV